MIEVEGKTIGGDEFAYNENTCTFGEKNLQIYIAKVVNIDQRGQPFVTMCHPSAMYVNYGGY